MKHGNLQEQATAACRDDGTVEGNHATITEFEKYEIVSSSKRAFRLSGEVCSSLRLRVIDELFVGPSAQNLSLLESSDRRAERMVVQIVHFRMRKNMGAIQTPKRTVSLNVRSPVMTSTRSSAMSPTEGFITRRKGSSPQLVIFSHFTVFGENKNPLLAGDLQHRSKGRVPYPIPA